MISRMARGLTLCCGMVAALVATPSESYALCGLFDGLFGCCGRTSCRPAYCGYPACSPCGVSSCGYGSCGTSCGYGSCGLGSCGSSCGYGSCGLGSCGSSCGYGSCGLGTCGVGSCGAACNPCSNTVCNYMPQTCYRPECVSVPVTTYRCVSACDPCTGCPTTAMAPMTSFMRQVRYVPYTSYRPVCATVAAPVVAAPACAAPAVGVPAVGVPAVAAPAVVPPPATLTPTPTPSFYPSTPVGPSSGCCSPATYGYGSSPVIATPSVPATQYPIPSTPVPSLNNSPVTPPSTYNYNMTPLPSTDQKIIPQGTINGSSGSSGTWTSQPEGRLTRLPAIVRPQPVDEDTRNLVVPAVFTSPSKNLDDSGWRAARR